MTDPVRSPHAWQQLAAQAAVSSPVPSPCANVCRIDEASGLCVGCLRTLPEIAGWSRLDDAAKRRLWATLPTRIAVNPPDSPAPCANPA